MIKFKNLIMGILIGTMLCTTPVFAAPSPTAGTVTIVSVGTGKTTAAQISAPTYEQLEQLAAYINHDAIVLGMTPTIKSTININAPADYTGGEVPIVFAVSGLKDGATNVFAYILLPNGKTVVVPCTVKKGCVGFYAPAFGTVSIVVMSPASPKTASPKTLH